ncbi:MAG: L-iditol 2-dehydrogenase [Rhodopirellula sp.]|jgi:2-desacetyl-2-hydroxyethyl bacteriochlorophyllide A dehydrogenase|nr:L-iditol 2-dehydrogenase [Rhodopirellula sp.]|tara:strand:+ start:1118 stop:2149 length:1032 start_codon:yes stop_codon:yes gene_type:complete
MRAILLEEPKNFKTIEVDEAPAPGAGEALVAVHRVGICGTDISGYLGKFPFYSYPRIPGHELGVEVLEVGEGVENVKSGDRCSVEPYINNEASFASQRGRSNCCDNLEVLGVHTDGGMRERFIVPARKLHPSHGGLEMEQLALVETLAIGCHAVDRAKPTADDTVLIIGAGPIGLTCVEFTRLTPAKMIVMDMNEDRLAFCRNNMNVEKTVTFKGDDSEEQALRDANGGELPTIVIDATGNAQSMANAMNFVAHTGTLVYVGITLGDIVFPHRWLHAKEMNLLSSRNALPGDFARIIKLIEDGKIDTRPWITHRTTLEELPEVFDSYTKPETGVIKAIVSIQD